MSVSSITATIALPGNDTRLAEMRLERRVQAIRRSARYKYAGAIMSLVSVIGFIILTALGALTGYITLISTDPIIGYGGLASVQVASWIYVIFFKFVLRVIDDERDMDIRRIKRSTQKRSNWSSNTSQNRRVESKVGTYTTSLRY